MNDGKQVHCLNRKGTGVLCKVHLKFAPMKTIKIESTTCINCLRAVDLRFFEFFTPEAQAHLRSLGLYNEPSHTSGVPAVQRTDQHH